MRAFERRPFRLRTFWTFSLGVGVFGASGGCSSGGDAQKSWNELSSCIAGKAAAAELPERIKAIRQIQLGANSAGKDAWPARCAEYANALNQSISNSGPTAILKRKLAAKLNCSEEKTSCKLPGDNSLISTATELWEAAKSAELKTEQAPSVAAPAPAAEPALDAKSFKSFSPAPLRVVGPELRADGTALLLLKAEAGRGRPRACEFSPGFEKVTCTSANGQMPELPLQNVMLARSPRGAFASALGEEGLVAYDLGTGVKSEVRGTEGKLVADGVAVEGGTGDGSFVAVTMKAGKAGADVKLPLKVPLNKPIVAGDQIIWLEQVDAGVEFVAKSLTAGRLRDAGKIKGPFSGPFHVCEAGGTLAVATFERHAGQHGAKPTAGSDKTQFAVTQFRDGAWTKALAATLPFARLIDSEIVCTKAGVALSWAHRAADGLEVARLDCTLDACIETKSKLPDVDSKFWFAAVPIADKVLIAWRSGLGEARYRVASVTELAKATDRLLFDAQDFGGPNAIDASEHASGDAALLLFKNDRPVAVRFAADGSARVLAE
jgi:hypothetical protein